MTGYIVTNGETLDQDKINAYLNHTLLEPQPYAPNVSGAAASAAATFLRVGKLITVEFLITFSGASTGDILLSTPTPMASSSQAVALGSALGLDGGAAATRRAFTVVRASVDQVFFVVDSATSAATARVGTPWTWAATDTIGGRFTYWEA